MLCGKDVYPLNRHLLSCGVSDLCVVDIVDTPSYMFTLEAYDVAICIGIDGCMKDISLFIRQIGTSTRKWIWWIGPCIGSSATPKPSSYWESLFKEESVFKPNWKLIGEVKQSMLQNHFIVFDFPMFRDDLIILGRHNICFDCMRWNYMGCAKKGECSRI